MSVLRAGSAARRPLIGAAALAAASIATAPGPTTAAVSPTPHYVGQFDGQPESRAHFHLETTGTRKIVHFGLENLAFVCEDGVTRPSTFGSIVVPFTSARVFYRKRTHGQSIPISKTSVYEVKGRIMPGSTARGWIMFEEENYTPGRVDCNSNGRVHWQAERVAEPR